MGADSPSGFPFRPDKLPIGNSRWLPIGHSRHKARSNRAIDENNVTFPASSLVVVPGSWLPSAGPAFAGTAGGTPSSCHRPPDFEPVAGSGGPTFLGARCARLGVKPPHDGGRAPRPEPDS